MNNRINTPSTNGHSNTNVTGLALQTVPVRIHSFLYDKVKLCVEMENQTKPDGDREMNMADFIRVATAERVGRILKEEVSEIPPVIRGRGGSISAQAAKKAGLGSGEFQSRAVEIVSMLTMGYNADDLIQKLVSGETQVVGGNQPQQQTKPNSGQHQVQAHQNGPGVRSARRAM